MLNNAVEFLRKLSNANKVERFFNAGLHTKRFEELGAQLSQSLEGVHFVRDVQQLVRDHSDDAEDDEVDLPELITQIEVGVPLSLVCVFLPLSCWDGMYAGTSTATT